MARELTYLDFDVHLERGEEGTYRARVINAPAGHTPPVAFTMPFTHLEFENFVLRIGRPRRVVRRVDRPETAAIKTFGGQLYRALFHDHLEVNLLRSLSEAAAKGAGLRIRLRLGETPELAELPWEFLYDRTRNRFLSLSDRTPLVRFLEVSDPPRPLTVSPPLQILVMIASPSNYSQLDVEQEWSKLRTALAPLEESNQVQVTRLETATLAALRQRLRQTDWHVLHFIGHGGFDPQTQDGVLVLEDQMRRSRLVSGQDLGVLLHDHHPLRLVVLNACEGARADPSDPFSGTAQSLIQQGIPAVVAMQFEITDPAAITFASELYAAVADGYPLDAALAEARKAIWADGNQVEWATPVLHLRAPDGRIFNVAPTPGVGSSPPSTAASAPPASAVTLPTRATETKPVSSSPPRTSHADHVPQASYSLGVQLAEQGDVAGARAAYQEVIDSGHADMAPKAANNLGLLLAEQGDAVRARAAYQRAIDSDHPDAAPQAANRLGVLLEQQGDVAGSKAAYRRAIDSGHADMAPKATFNLGELLHNQGDVVGARAAFQRAIDSGHADMWPRAAFKLGELLRSQGDVVGARAAFQRAIDSGHADAAPQANIYLAAVLADNGDLISSRAILQRVMDSGHADAAPQAAVVLGVSLEEHSDVVGARAAYQRAIDSGHADMAPWAAFKLGELLRSRGDVVGARAAFQRAIDSGHAEYAPMATLNLGLLLAGQGDVSGARDAYQEVIESGHADMAPKAAFNLGLLLAEQGDVVGARAAFQRAIESGHADMAPQASFELGLLLEEQGDVAGARNAYRQVIHSGHADMAPRAAEAMRQL